MMPMPAFPSCHPFIAGLKFLLKSYNTRTTIRVKSQPGKHVCAEHSEIWQGVHNKWSTARWKRVRRLQKDTGIRQTEPSWNARVWWRELPLSFPQISQHARSPLQRCSSSSVSAVLPLSQVGDAPPGCARETKELVSGTRHYSLAQEWEWDDEHWLSHHCIPGQPPIVMCPGCQAAWCHADHLADLHYSGALETFYCIVLSARKAAAAVYERHTGTCVYIGSELERICYLM